MTTQDATVGRENAPMAAKQPASRSLKLLILFLCLIALAVIFATALFEWIVANYSAGRREESDIGIAVAFALIAIIGALAAMGQPRNAVGWVLLFCGLTIGLAGLGESLSYYLLTIQQGSADSALIVAWLAGIGWLTGIALLLLVFPFLFPNGRLPSRRWRPVFALVILFAIAVIGVTLVSPLFSRKYLDPSETDRLLGPLYLVFPFLALLGVVSLIVRYRRADADTRQQMKWLLVTIGAPIIAFLFLTIVEDFFGASYSNAVWGPLYLMIPIGLGISLLRYRMFDVDTVIRKTAVYSILSVLLALVYFGIIVTLQRVFSDVSGDTSNVAVVLSTLVIAALFLPLRRRVQAVIDRRFYRRKYDAEQVLARFAATARDETDLDALTAELLRVIQETMQPESVSIWLQSLERREPAETDDRLFPSTTLTLSPDQFDSL